MARSGEDLSLDNRARIVALVAALDELISVLRRHLDIDQAWLELLIELAGDVHDLLEADACIDSIDLRDVCKEVQSLVGNIDVNVWPDHDRNGDAQPTDLRRAQADCTRIIRDMCGASNGSAVNGSSNSTGAN